MLGIGYCSKGQPIVVYLQATHAGARHLATDEGITSPFPFQDTIPVREESILLLIPWENRGSGQAFILSLKCNSTD